MSNRREYEIAFVGLKPGSHQFDYDITDSFFEDFGEQDFKDCKAHIKLMLEKSSSSFMMLKFEMGGTVDVNCDRCNSNLPFQLFDEFVITVKMVDEPDEANAQEEDADVYYISRSESHLDVKTWIYEFINLSIPMQKTCEYEHMDGPFCNPVARELLNGLKPEEKEGENPIWKDLKKFKNLDSE